ncbi:hypothetical protein F0562_006250 [Nyssa sinensis]|uniref:Uncharacterized protein n=1 Tax=Nyssa sinensis TaxID=561372 RepID=A0A5J5AR94_9ASTE|nr:hypothetical protein F0562_006250 [Nyssa sinensis]
MEAATSSTRFIHFCYCKDGTVKPMDPKPSTTTTSIVPVRKKVDGVAARLMNGVTTAFFREVSTLPIIPSSHHLNFATRDSSITFDDFQTELLNYEQLIDLQQKSIPPDTNHIAFFTQKSKQHYNNRKPKPYSSNKPSGPSNPIFPSLHKQQSSSSPPPTQPARFPTMLDIPTPTSTQLLENTLLDFATLASTGMPHYSPDSVNSPVHSSTDLTSADVDTCAMNPSSDLPIADLPFFAPSTNTTLLAVTTPSRNIVTRSQTNSLKPKQFPDY